jgi:hypothetical protein
MVLRDVRGLDNETIEDLRAWAAHALLNQALADSTNTVT